uniref:metallophosphoesterase family protein n=1 Tax=Fulvivirga sp. TaxID=1931237 RepID=UPI00404961D0
MKLRSIRLGFFLLLASLLGCSNEKKPVKILVMGDVQLKSNLSRFTQELWEQQTLDTLFFDSLFNDVLDRENPDFIFQTGDWVNYNNSQILSISDTLGNTLTTVPMPYDEWAYMNGKIPNALKDKFYMAFGNHESYDTIVWKSIYHPDYDILADVKPNPIVLLPVNRKKEQLLNHFPSLKQATFLNSTGTYFISNEHFSLISIDGLDSDRNGLLEFIEDKLKSVENSRKPIFAICHYPVFSGQKVEVSELVLTDIRERLIELFDKYHVEMYMNGHEHFYLRYNQKGIREGNFGSEYPDYTKYLTISDFANPYPRKVERFGVDSLSNFANYFHGSHYAVINLNHESISTVIYGLSDKGWTTIDSLHRNIELSDR